MSVLGPPLWTSLGRFLPTLLLPFLLASTEARSEVKCSCPSIKADGEGNSSCSSNESGGRCTIDYNVFAGREVRAAQALSDNLGLTVPSRPGLGVQEAFSSVERSGQIPELVLVYLSVAAVDQSVTHPKSIDLGALGTVAKIVLELRSDIAKAFSTEAREQFAFVKAEEAASSKDFVVRSSSSFVISYGCVEVTTDQVSVMFKARWSPYRLAPRCSPA